MCTGATCVGCGRTLHVNAAQWLLVVADLKIGVCIECPSIAKDWAFHSQLAQAVNDIGQDAIDDIDVNSQDICDLPRDPVACVGCGCDDYHTCRSVFGEPCSWLRVDYGSSTGVCSECYDSVEAWDKARREASTHE